MPESRRFDGAPETAIDKAFFDLRESGYTGPFDWDAGQPCTDPEILSIFDALDRATARALAAQDGDGRDLVDTPDAARWTPELLDDEF